MNDPTNDLHLLLVQAETRWHDPAGNRDAIEAAVGAAPSPTAPDLIVLPETFTTGFSNAAIEHAEPQDAATLQWMRRIARERNAAVTGSIVCRAGDAVFNRLLFVTPDGGVSHYDKRHLFRMAKEHQHFAAGDERIVVEFRGWRICPLVCYDLRFPVFSRNRMLPAGRMDYDLLLYVANWPAARQHAWQSLLPARAIENLSCVAGVNRTGTDGNGIVYAGGSAAYDAEGRALVQLTDASQVTWVRCEAASLRAWRARFPAYLDADAFRLE